MTEPIPVEDGVAATCCVVLDHKGWRTAWMIGRRKTVFGEPFKKASDAAQASRTLNESIFGAYK